MFHLGKKAINYLYSNIGDDLGEDFKNIYNWDQVKETFILSCLLHDVGHSPFSHTGESFYNASTIFEKEFQGMLRSLTFDKDVEDKGTGKPHEAMSAIIGINLLERMGYEFEKEFFARAIMGIEYSSKETKYQIRNCLISMLNGSLIDVDKLDRWIQSNPTILYECKLLEHAIRRYNHYIMKKYSELKMYGNIFNKKAISKEGFPKKDKVKIRLLCDDDIIVFLKNEDESIIGEHYFSRDMRFKPLWKSEAEYSLKVRGGIAPKKLENMLEVLRDSSKYGVFFLNEEEQQRLEGERAKEGEDKQNQYTAPIYLAKFFEDFANTYGFNFQFAIIRESAFISNKRKIRKYRK